MQEEKMGLDGFCGLSIVYRAKYTWMYGDLLATKVGLKYSYHLYQIESFYVELKYNKVANKIEKIEGFENTECLMKYLETVSIKNLLL